jgi:ubiquinone/menaquinone biosynthesis C-methylase UbiE
MGFYERYLCPHISKVVNQGKALQPMRHRVVTKARGVVLEIGVGTGSNFPHFDPQQVTKLYALEPAPGMLKLARREAVGRPFPIEFLDLPGERIPLADHSVDTVLTTFTLCTIPEVVTALRGMARVLKPGGELLFWEHGEAPDAKVRRWQKRMEPLHGRLFPGCHLMRCIPALIEQGGFTIREMDQEYAAEFPRFLRFMSYFYEGVATIN